MSEEEKKAIELLSKEDTEYYYRYIDVREAVSIVLNLIENQQTELTNLKEIEKSHQEENGKLRVELEQEKEKNTFLEGFKVGAEEAIAELKEKNEELEIELAVRDNIKVDKLVEKYRYYRQLANSYQANCISKDKIKELLENEIIDISGFRCIAVEDIENLLEG